MNERVRVLASRRYGTTSPLRYPGGKSALAGFFGDVIDFLELRDATYVEPYAGGVGAGIALLRQGIVKKLVINDIDPAVHAFWQSVVEDNERFVRRVQTVPLTIDVWQEQRAIYKSKAADPFDLGFAFFFLNRTNRSGILNAGVIGGQAQTGTYKIDARFNRETLVARLTAIGDLAERISVTDLDGRTVIQNYAENPSTFMYIDPPYVQAGSQLYLNAFDSRDHRALAEVVNSVQGAHWLMTYDTAPLIQRLYANRFQCELELTYSARYPGQAEELLVASPRVANAVNALQLGDHRVAVAESAAV